MFQKFTRDLRASVLGGGELMTAEYDRRQYSFERY